MTQKSLAPVKVGVIGLGRFGRLHALTLACLAEADLVALVARRQASLDALAPELPGVPGWTSLQQALAESTAEAWVVACTTAAHVPVVRALLEAGKTVLLEKPVADNLEEARSLAPLVRPDSSNLMIGHIVLFNSEFQQLRVEARTDPVHYSARFHRTGAGEVDLAVAQLQWSDGLLASFAASYLTPGGMPPRGFDRMEVFGTGWSARINPNPRPIEVWGERAHWPMALEIRADVTGATGMLAEELRCFCRVVRGQQSVPVGATYGDALQVQQWMDRLASELDRGQTTC